MPKTNAQRQKASRERLEASGGKVVAFRASPGTVAFLERNKQQGIGPTEAINNLVSGSTRKVRSKQ